MKQLDAVDRIRIAKPCPASWDDMQGDERVRHCTQCRRNVYNLREMSREEAARLIESREGKVCVRIYRREDGRVMTADCPKGLARARRRIAAAVLAVASMVLFGAFALSRAVSRRSDAKAWNFEDTEAHRLLSSWAQPEPSPQPFVGSSW